MTSEEWDEYKKRIRKKGDEHISTLTNPSDACKSCKFWVKYDTPHKYPIGEGYCEYGSFDSYNYKISEVSECKDYQKEVRI